MPIAFDPADLESTRRVNRRLARLPRLRLYHPAHRTVLQALVTLGDRIQRPPPPHLGIVAEDRIISALNRSVRVRILRPATGVRGVHIHIHGGGWTIGSARMNDVLNAELVARHGMAVVSVEYRLIPRVPLFAALDDCETAARWVLESGLAEFGAGATTIGGESAGAHLAAATILRLREHGADFNKVAGAALVYGCYDLDSSTRRDGAGPETLILHGPTLPRLVDKALGTHAAARRDPAISPIYAELHGLPPALFLVGTRDPLLEDSERMHAKWAAQSGNAELSLVPEAPHGFNHLGTSTAHKANAYVRHWINERLTAISAG